MIIDKEDKEFKKDNDNENDIIPDWSKIDATSIYRSGGGIEQERPHKDMNKPTNNSTWNIIFIILALMIIGLVGYFTKT